MTNFSTNQVMQFYVADAALTKEDIKNLPGRGFTLTIGGKRTDIIENVLWGKLTSATALATPCKEVTIAWIAPKVVGGENYIVRVSYPEVFGAGIESWTTKTVVTQPKAGEDAANVMTALEKELKNALPKFITVSEGGDSDIILTANPDTDGYERGVRPVVMPNFRVSVNKVVIDSVEEDWAEVTEGKATKEPLNVNGSYKLADMEYFALGERGDEYRQMGWPAVSYKADYKIIPADDAAYDVLVVHYAYAGNNDQSHLSEKDLIIAGSSAHVSSFASVLAEVTGAPFTKVDASGKETPLAQA